MAAGKDGSTATGALKEGSKDAKEPASGDTKDASHQEETREAASPSPGLLAIEVAKGAQEPGAAKQTSPMGVVFTLGHPAGWDLNDFFLTLTRHKIRVVLDARPTPESGPQPDAVRVACSASGIAYDRQPMLSKAYRTLVAQARGRQGEARSPCVLLSGLAAWRLREARRCVARLLAAKGLEVRHLMWSGDVDREAAAQCEKELRREDFKYPKAPPAGPRPSPQAPPPVMRARAKAAPAAAGQEPAAGRGASAKVLMPSRPKAGPSPAQEDMKGQAKPKEAATQKDQIKPKEPFTVKLRDPAAPKDQARPKEPLIVKLKEPAAPKEPYTVKLKGPAAPKDQVRPKEPFTVKLKEMATPKVESAPKEASAAKPLSAKATPEDPAASSVTASAKAEVLQARPKASSSGTQSAETVKGSAASKNEMLQARPKASSAPTTAPQAPPTALQGASTDTKSAATKTLLGSKEDDMPSKKPRTGPEPQSSSPADLGRAPAASAPTVQEDLWSLILNKPGPAAASEPAAGRQDAPKAEAQARPAGQRPAPAPQAEAEAAPSSALQARPKAGPAAAKAPPAEAAKAKAAAGSSALQASAKAPGSRPAEGQGRPQPPPVMRASAKGGGPQPPRGLPPKAAGREGGAEEGPRPPQGTPPKPAPWSLLDGGKRRRL